ncbi:MAG: hypothetical protein RBU27_05435 [Bacteroidota bacterium]|nr:hypothetical protein [Bacteroidota bacterium]
MRPQFPAYGVGKSASMADLLNIGSQEAQGGGGDQKGREERGTWHQKAHRSPPPRWMAGAPLACWNSKRSLAALFNTSQ